MERTGQVSLAQMLQAFDAERPRQEAYELLPVFLRGSATDIESFIDAIISRRPKGGVFLDAAFSHVSEEALDRLVNRWVRPLREGELNDAIESLIAYVSLQRPAALHPFLERFFALRPNDGSYYADWPWRDAPIASLGFLVSQASGSGVNRSKAFNCLLETRLPQALEACVELAEGIPLPHPVRLYLECIGFSGDRKPLYSPDVFHLSFPRGYFAPPARTWSLQGLHPTWHLGSSAGRVRFGGEGAAHCGLCGGILHALVELPEAMVFESGGSGLIALQTCLSCLGWEQKTLHYRHEQSGAVASLDRGQVTPQFPAKPLKGCEVGIAATPSRWCWQDWALSNSRENLNRVGGFPCWVQDAEHPECPECEQKMRFVMQLDSDLPTEDGEAWMWGSGGIGYGFSCSRCRILAYLWQCT